jgi:8-oxo-dGTP pyrophosphatase MutT (NUDIX family)
MPALVPGVGSQLSLPMTDAQAAEPKPSATILLLRDEPRFEVLMVKRHHQIDFASGALVFPGGKIQQADADDAWADHVCGWERYDTVQRALRIGAIRESFEEAGVLLADGIDASRFAAASDLSVRKAVDKGELPFINVVRDLGAKLRLDGLAVFSRWITPTMMPKRFDTYFYAMRAPADQIAVCDGRETVEAEWIAPNEAIALAASKQRTIIFPTLMNLKLLAEAESAADCIARAEQRPLVAVLPWIEQRDGAPFLVIPRDAGYGDVSEPLNSAIGG